MSADAVNMYSTVFYVRETTQKPHSYGFWYGTLFYFIIVVIHLLLSITYKFTFVCRNNIIM